MLHYQSFGEPKTGQPSLVLVHGLFGSADNLSVIRRQFEDHMHVINVDLPNHGKSPRYSTWSFEEAARALISTIESAGIEQCYLVGHSLGGKVSMAAAHYAPALIKKLAVLDIAPVKYSHRHHNVLAGLDNVNLEQINGRKDAQAKLAEHVQEAGVISFLLKSLYQDDNKHWQWRFNVPVIVKDYEKITDWPFTDIHYQGPVTFIKGKNSDYITQAYEQQIRQQFPNAKAKIVDAGHWLHAEKPQVVNTLLTRVLLDN